MDYIVPQPYWKDEDVYIIGGGPSLKSFDWELLRGLNTIGCNDAYKLGFDFCKICVFGDFKWWQAHKDKLLDYNGYVYAAEPSLRSCTDLPEWLVFLKRYAKGLHTDGVGWNGNTGAIAINLAILLGATRIFLLGFDMKRTRLDSNWHPNNLDKNGDEVYKKFVNWFRFLEEDWKNKFSHIDVINVTNDSDLECFPKVSVDDFWMKGVLRERESVAI